MTSDHQCINENYRGLVDMGSNGIRFSITDISPSGSRNLPTIYLDRAAISLYDAQHQAGEVVPIPGYVIDQVITALLRFKLVCQDFGVPKRQIRIIATEATRVAKNSEEYRGKIKEATGWEVELLPKEEEGRIGAYGIASSLPSVHGLVMDLGGGSTQLSWLHSEKGDVEIGGNGSTSLPYGAAALIHRLAAASTSSEARIELEQEITSNLKKAIQDINLSPNTLKEGVSLYLSGGGFRGWGFVLMSTHPVSPYPIPIINGFYVPATVFHDTSSVQLAVQSALPDSGDGSLFRVSKRRASQVPAVAFLVSCMSNALPQINDVHFCQGGVREGTFYSQLPAKHRLLDPLVSATQSLADATLNLDATGTSAAQSGKKSHMSSHNRDITPLDHLLHRAIPKDTPSHPDFSRNDLATAIINVLHLYFAAPRDLHAASALRCTTTGHLANAHGLSHVQRAALAVALCERYGGTKELSPSDNDFYYRLLRLLDEKETWWFRYLGRVAGLIGIVYPAYPRRGDKDAERMEVQSDYDGEVVKLKIRLLGKHKALWGQGVREAAEDVEKVGKRKNWYAGEVGYKVKVDVKG